MNRAHIIPVTIVQDISNGIVAIMLKSFNKNTASSLSDKLEIASENLGKNMKGLILDLRGNPGGLLKQSVKVADLFLTQGDIISTRGRHADSLHKYEAGGRDLALGLPVAVLIDGKSASAAEILAAALQDRNRAVIIGTTSFGKGSVQTILLLPNGGEITLTWSRLVAPSGYMFHGLGIRPELCTSGLEGDPKRIIEKFIVKRKQFEIMHTDWGKGSPKDKNKRAQLRKTCPPQHRRNDLELKIAQHLIDHPALYARVLNLSDTINEAHY
jgi:carboxyl-terminal processing protease